MRFDSERVIKFIEAMKPARIAAGEYLNGYRSKSKFDLPQDQFTHNILKPKIETPTALPEEIKPKE